MGRRRKKQNSVEPPSESKRQRVARAELKQVEQFLRTATDVASARPLSERERELVAEARRLRRQLYVRLGPEASSCCEESSPLRKAGTGRRDPLRRFRRSARNG